MREPQGRSEPATSRRSSARPGSIADDQPRTVLTIETLTFLFTDIEGSTALLRAPRRQTTTPRRSREHHGIVRDALAAHGGTEEGTQGDSFFATFTSPSACVAAAIQIQRALGDARLAERLSSCACAWACTPGEASEASTGLVGYEVHRAARIGAVAHGGQVLLSSACGGARRGLPPRRGRAPRPRDASTEGPRPARDTSSSWSLLGCATSSRRCARSTTPSCRTTCRPRSARSSVVAEELAEVVELLESARLVTLTGAGGSGKTRLALQAAAEVLDGAGEGVWFVELAPVSDPELVAERGDRGARDQRRPKRDRPRRAAARAQGPALPRRPRQLRAPDRRGRQARGPGRQELSQGLARSRPRASRSASTARRSTACRSLSACRHATSRTAEDLAGLDAVELFVARARSHDDGVRGDRLERAPLVGVDVPAPRRHPARHRARGCAPLVDVARGPPRRLDQRFRLLTGGSRNALPAPADARGDGRLVLRPARPTPSARCSGA